MSWVILSLHEGFIYLKFYRHFDIWAGTLEAAPFQKNNTTQAQICSISILLPSRSLGKSEYWNYFINCFLSYEMK